METIDVAVVGGGVTGLAAARGHRAQRAARCACSSAIRVRAWTPAPTTAASSTPASTIPPGSLKPRCASRAPAMLYAFCARARRAARPLRQAHRRPGRRERGRPRGAAGAGGGQRRRGARDRRRGVHPPARAARRAASPRSSRPTAGVVEPEAYVRALAARACEEAGVVLPARHARSTARAPRRRHRAAHRRGVDPRRTRSSTPPGCTPTRCRRCSAASRSPSIRAAASTPSSRRRAAHLVNALVYPLPHASGHGLGVHLTQDDAGRACWLGPTSATRTARTTTSGDRLPLEAFLEPARRLLPGLDLGGPAARRAAASARSCTRRASRSPTS